MNPGPVDQTRVISRLRTAHPLLIALTAAVALKIFYVGLAAALAPGLPIDPKVMISNIETACHTCNLTNHLIPQSGTAEYRFSGVWQRFDTLWYLRIAEAGYDNPAGIVFFPLYPVLIRGFTPLLGPIQSALLLALAGTVLLFWALLRLVEMDFGRDVALRSLLVTALWPQSFILFAGYVDSLVMGLILAALYFARTKRFGAAIPLAFLAGMAKSVGVFAGIPLAIYAWRERSWKGAVAAVAAAAGTGVYVLYLWTAGFPPLTQVYETHWNIYVSAPWQTLAGAVGSLAHHPHPMLILNLILLLGVVVLCALKPLPTAYWTFALAIICLFLTKSTDPPLLSLSRYLVLVFPAFVNLARTKEWAWLLILPALLNIFLTVEFLKWWFVV